MNLEARAIVFSVAFGVAYIVVYYFDLPLFIYYPMTGQLSYGTVSVSAPAVHWYGWVTGAALISALVAAIVPPRLAARIPPDAPWVVAVVLVVAVFMYERRWFF